MTIKIIGIDPSLTGTGISIIDTDANIELLCTLSNALTGMNRISWIRRKIRELLPPKPEVGYVLIEGYGFGCHGKTFNLGELGGGIRLAVAEDLGLDFFDIAPSLLKKFITGKGNSNKNVMLEQVYRNYKVGSETLKDDNQVDAYALSRFGLAYYNWKILQEKTSKIQIECFKAMGPAEGIDIVEVTAQCLSKKK